MSYIIMLMPADASVNIGTLAEGIAQSTVKDGKKVAIYTPVQQGTLSTTLPVIQGVSLDRVEQALLTKKEDVLLEDLTAKLFEDGQQADVIVVVGLLPTQPYFAHLNNEIAKAFAAEIVSVVRDNGTDVDSLIKHVRLVKAGLDAGVQVAHCKTIVIGVEKNSDTFSKQVDAAEIIAILPAQYDVAMVSNTLSATWLMGVRQSVSAPLLTPPAFRYQLTDLARKANKRIVLPEGDEPRTVKAAAICAERGIAQCVLLGDPVSIKAVAEQQNVVLGAGVEIIDAAAARENYVDRLVELRKSKGMTEEMAREQLKDNVVLGTLMLERNEVDGLVSGAVHTTANTIRPPLQLIKTAPGSSLVSSVFFMLLPEQVYVFGDCAININPTPAELSEIAIQSADTAKAFGIEPRVAMLSYSTANSGSGPDVDAVREATALVKQKRPDILIDGPLQYDASVTDDVAKAKAPSSPVAGKANVMIFPNLNAGNIGYKAVQRAANLVSIGPMLQGMRKPVNDLSRGALVDDIIYTIALTAIQAKQAEQH